MPNRKTMALAFLTTLLVACTGGEPELPGDQPNARLATLLETSIDEEIRRMNPVWAPGLLPQAPEQARAWLREIDQVVARCRYGPRNQSKANLLEYDITLRQGAPIIGVFSGQRCLYGVARPLVMRVRFVDGRVDQVTSDGREREAPVDAALGELRQFAHSVVRADWSRRPAHYFPPDQTPADIAREWQAKP